MARKKKKKRRLKKGAALVLKWSIAMIIIGTAAFFLMNMVYNRGIYVKTHPLVLDMEEDVSAEGFIETWKIKREEVKNIHRHSNGCIKIKQRRRLTVYITSQ